MKMTITPIKIIEDPANEVKSDKIFPNRKVKDKDGNYIFHEEGIFSEKIFGKFGHCRCGALRKPGYCEECECRVLNKRKMPDFYVKFNFDLPNRVIDYGKYNKTLFKNLLYYRGFVYEGKYVEFDLKNDMSIYEQDKILFGKDAIMSLVPIDDTNETTLAKSTADRQALEEWYENSVYRLISIPHTSHRKITFQNDNYFIGDLNELYIDMIRLNNKYERLKNNSKLNALNELNVRFSTCSDLEDLYNQLFQILAKNKRNVIDNELRGQPETGMIRAVMTNNFSLDEDVILIGKYFIETLYPKFYRENLLDEDGNKVDPKNIPLNAHPDIKAINKILEDEKYLVLFNRQPTIGAKSIMAMIPEFSEKDSEMFVIQANPIVYDGLAADVDGDSLNVIALYSKEACEEARKLLPNVNYIEGSSSSIRNGILEEFKYVDEMIGDK